MKRRSLGKTSGLVQEINSRLVSARRKEPSWGLARATLHMQSWLAARKHSSSHVSCGSFPYRSWMKWKRDIRSPWPSSTHSCRASERQPSPHLGRLSPSRASSLTQALRWVSKTGETLPGWREWVPAAPRITVCPFTSLTFQGPELGRAWHLAKIIGRT